jgi:hypothetical protein
LVCWVIKTLATPYFKREAAKVLKFVLFVKKYWRLFAQYNN